MTKLFGPPCENLDGAPYPSPSGGADATASPAVREKVHEKDGTVLLYVPGGVYPMGADDLTDQERPAHTVRLSPFWIAKAPVTNEQYSRFMQANPGYRRPGFWSEEIFNRPEQPVVGVSWEDSQAYCKWAGLILPSESQWEAACRGPEGRAFAWGDEPPTPELTNFGGLDGRTTDVHEHPAGAGPFGTLDQTGNVSEWCADVFDAEAYRKREDGVVDPLLTQGDPFRVIRGGSWLDKVDYLHAAMRFRYWPRLRRRFIGFRCAMADS